MLHFVLFYTSFLISTGYCLNDSMNDQLYVTKDTKDCSLIEVASTGPAGSVQWDMMGYYSIRSGRLNEKPIYQHKDYQLFLYYLEENGGYWIIGEDIGEDVGGIQNGSCDDFIVPTEPNCNSGWMYGDRNETWQEDVTIKVVCKPSLNEICHWADCSKPSVSILCADECKENYLKSLSVYTDTTKPKDKNENVDSNFQDQNCFETEVGYWKYLDDTPMFLISSLIVSLTIISFQAGGILIALALKYFETNESYKQSNLNFEVASKNRKSPANQWRVLKLLQKERSQYLKRKYWKKWKFMRNGEYIWMNSIPE